MKGLDDHITGKDDPNNPANEHEEEFYILKNTAEIKENKIMEGIEKNAIRCYMTSYPNGFNLQIRSNSNLNPFNSTGKKRNLLASVSISLKEIEQLYNFALNESKKYEKK